MALSRLKMRNTSPTIVADVRRFSHQINTDEVFDTHRPPLETARPQENLLHQVWRQATR
jgi:hypothetical protein